jgi:DNA-binding MarR family transcriptional regulator
MTDERPIEEELIELADELEAAGLIKTGVGADGNETWSLTPAGRQVANQLAMSSEQDAATLLSALLEATSGED